MSNADCVPMMGSAILDKGVCTHDSCTGRCPYLVGW